MPIIQAVDRALKILDLFDERDRELSITEISKRMQLHKSTVHSLLKTLQKHRYIVQNEENGKYSLGLKLLERGNFVMSTMDIRAIAKRHLEHLSDLTGFTVHLVILDGSEGVYIDKVEGTGSTVLYSKIGRRVPIHTSAVGKSLVAFKTDEEIEQLLKGYTFHKRTENSIQSREVFEKEIETVRMRGYAVDNEENEPGIYCISVPVKDHSGKVIAAISISMPVTTVSQEKVDEYVRLLQDTTQSISEDLGYGYQII
ncbi:MAG: IclR family transcriptional regulator [Bacillaceae bacterium]|nr:IclR family transcriptional regulator [Bacillaceae bacterium]